MARLQSGQSSAWAEFRERLLRRSAARLGEIEPAILACYAAQIEATPEDVRFGEDAGNQGSTCLVVVYRGIEDGAAARARQEWVHALVDAYGSLVGGAAPNSLLEIELVSEGDMAERRGAGAAIGALHLPAVEIWHR
jgi:hypothetical protein